MPKRLSVEERIRRLEENRQKAVEQAVKRINAIYNARIDLLREKGLKPRKRKGPLSLQQRVELGKDRFVFFRKRVYEYMGTPPEEAQRRAEADYEKFRGKYLSAFGVK
jgi:hypothetical protein